MNKWSLKNYFGDRTLMISSRVLQNWSILLFFFDDLEICSWFLNFWYDYDFLLEIIMDYFEIQLIRIVYLLSDFELNMCTKNLFDRFVEQRNRKNNFVCIKNFWKIIFWFLIFMRQNLYSKYLWNTELEINSLCS